MISFTWEYDLRTSSPLPRCWKRGFGQRPLENKLCYPRQKLWNLSDWNPCFQDDSVRKIYIHRTLLCQKEFLILKCVFGISFHREHHHPDQQVLCPGWPWRSAGTAGTRTARWMMLSNCELAVIVEWSALTEQEIGFVRCHDCLEGCQMCRKDIVWIVFASPTEGRCHDCSPIITWNDCTSCRGARWKLFQ